MPGRELIDTMDAVLRHDFSARDLPGHGLKAVARHFGIAGPEREYIRGEQVHDVYRRDPDRVRRYASDDVDEVAGLSRLLGGAAFALARMAPRRYERLADAGAATGVIDPLLVRAYLRAGKALPAHEEGDGTPHTGAALHLFAAGVAQRVVKADVASLYPSLMRAYRIGPARDHLGALLALVDGLVERRLAAKADARRAPAGSAERSHARGDVGGAEARRELGVRLPRGRRRAHAVRRRARRQRGDAARTRDARSDVPRAGRARRDAARGRHRRRLLRGARRLDRRRRATRRRRGGRAAAAARAARVRGTLSRDALARAEELRAAHATTAQLLLRGVAFRSSRAEPFGEAFLRRAIACLLAGDVAGVRAAYLDTVVALHRREVPTRDVSSLVRLTKTPREYREVRAERHEAPYEAMLASGRTTWRAGERVRVYRTSPGAARLVRDDDPRDYDVEHYARVLRDTFAQRLVARVHARRLRRRLRRSHAADAVPAPPRRVRTILTGSALP